MKYWKRWLLFSSALVALVGVSIPALSKILPTVMLQMRPDTTQVARKLALVVEVTELTDSQKKTFEAYIQSQGLNKRGGYKISEINGKRIWMLIGEDAEMRKLESEMKRQPFGTAVSVGL